MYDRYSAGGRYGIWGQNEAPLRMDALVDPLQQAMGTASGIQNLFGNYYKNKLAGLNVGLKQNQLNYSNQTLQDSIAAENTKNRTDTQYYPLMQQAKLQQDEQTIKEIMSRTGLNYANAKMALAHIPLLQAETAHERTLSDPMSTFNAAFNAYNNAQDNSPQKEYLAGILNNFMGGGNLKAPKNSSAGSGMGTIMGNIADGGIQLNPIGGSNRSPFKQAYMETNSADNPIDSNAPGQTIESPTTQSASQAQMRKAAESEIHNIYPTVMNGLKPYQGPFGSASLVKDSFLASQGNKDAQQRLDNYAVSKRFLPELASINARQATGREPGIELNREYENAMFPGLPSKFANWTIPAVSQQNANNTYLPLQGRAVTSAINEERGGFPQSGAPVWANSPASEGGYFTGSGYVPRTDRLPSGRNNNLSPSQIEDARNINGIDYVRIGQKWHRRK